MDNFFRYLFIFCALIFFLGPGNYNLSHAAAKNSGSCKLGEPLTETQLGSFADLQSFLQKNSSQLKSLEDFVCCLPQEYQENYIVGMSSKAGQNGTPDSPRVIVFSKDENTPGRSSPPRFMMSFNGGKSHSTQPHSVEIAFFNSEVKELEFYDVNFKKGISISEKNPKLCLVCHGETGKNPVGGPKYIFDSFSYWPRFIGGTNSCNPESDRLQNILADKSASVIKQDPRFKCLDKKLLQANTKESAPSKRYPLMNAKLGNFDNRNLSQDSYRASRWLRSLPEYEKYKYFLFGAEYCNNSKMTDWMPQEKLQQLLAKTHLDPRLLEDGDLKANFNTALKQDFEKNQETNSFHRLHADDPARSYHEGYSPNYSHFACSPGLPTDIPLPGFSDDDFKQKTPDLLFHLDRILKSDPMGQSMPKSSVRLFIEGEGHNLGMVLTTMTEFGSQLTRGHTNILLSAENDSSELKKLFKEIPKEQVNKYDSKERFNLYREFNGLDKNDHLFEPIEGKNQVCSDLKRLSMLAFTNYKSENYQGLGADKSQH